MALSIPLPGLRRTERILPIRDRAAHDVADLVWRCREERSECDNDGAAAEREAARAATASARALEQMHVTEKATTATIAMGFFGVLAAGSNWFLDQSMFRAMGVASSWALLLASVLTGIYAGVGVFVVTWWRAGGAYRPAALALAGGLALLGVVLVPALAAARVQESLGPKIIAAQSTVDNGSAFGTDTDPSLQLQRRQAQTQLLSLQHQRQVELTVFEAVLASTLATEFLLAGYSFDLAAWLRSRQLEALAHKRREDAVAAKEDARAVDTSAERGFIEIARRYRLADIDDIDDIVRNVLDRINHEGAPTSNTLAGLDTEGTDAATRHAVEFASDTASPSPNTDTTPSPDPVPVPETPATASPWDGVWA